MAEVGLLAFARTALDVGRAVLPPYRTRFSKHRFTQPQLLAILCLMCYEDWTFSAQALPASGPDRNAVLFAEAQALGSGARPLAPHAEAASIVAGAELQSLSLEASLLSPKDANRATTPLDLGYLRDPGFFEWNFGLQKRFALPREGMFLDLAGQATNASNSPRFGGPDTNIAHIPSFQPGIGETGFGTLPTSQEGNARSVAVSMKLSF